MNITTRARKRRKIQQWDTVCNKLNISIDSLPDESKLLKNNVPNHNSSMIGEALSEVCYELKSNEFVTDVVFNKSLDLLTEDEMQKLFQAIHKCKSVTYLNFSLYTSKKHNPQRMLKYLVPLIRSNNTINTLVLRNIVLEKGVLLQLKHALCNSKILTSVDLSFTDMKDNSMIIVQDMIQDATNLSSLTMSHLNPSIGVTEIKRLAENIKHASSLQSLDLSMNRIGCEGAMILANSVKMYPNKLTALDLSSNSIGKDGLAAIATLIRKNNQIEKINLSNNFVDDETGTEIMRALEHNTNLISLDLSNSGYVYFGEESYKDVCTMLSTNKTLRTLNLNGNDAFANPQQFRCVALHLQSNTTLHTILMSLEQRNEPHLQKLLKHNISILEFDGSRPRNKLQHNPKCIAKQLKRNRYIQINFGNPTMCFPELLPNFLSKLSTTEIIFQCLRLTLPRIRERI